MILCILTEIKYQNLQLENFHTWGGGGRYLMRSEDRDHPGQHDETPHLLKYKQISWACGACL